MIIERVLVIGYVWPEPNSSAAGSHMMSLLNLFKQQDWHVTFVSPAQLSEHQADLTKLDIDTHEIELNSSSFDAFITNLNPNLVLFDRFMLEEQFAWRVAQACPSAIRILDTEDLHFLRDARHQAHKKGRTLESSDLHTDMANREVAAIFRSDLSLIISDFELALLQQSFSVPEQILHHCPFMLDDHNDTLATTPFEQRQHFITIGSFRHAPNWDAVLWLKQEIWPLIKQQLPEAEMHIYGSYPPPKATQLHNEKQGFLIKGWVEDAPTVMANARVCLAPLRFGAGIKGKLTQAMQCGTPSVTTQIGVEGIIGKLPWPGFVSDEAVEFARMAVELYTSKTIWMSAQAAGFNLLDIRFNRQTIATKLIEKINRICGDLDAHRKSNFVGAMLQHHQHKSTQYMAQWIEAKNKLK